MRFAILTTALLLLTACGSEQTESGVVETSGGRQEQTTERLAVGLAVLEGQVQFSDDVDLPIGAVLIVSLNDISLADAPSVLLAEQLIRNPVGLPIAFRLEYDPDKINQRNTYALKARVDLDGRLPYINDTYHGVLTRGAPQA